MTPLQRRILAALDQRGEILGQDLAYEFCQFTIMAHNGQPHYPTPQRASQIGGALMAPLIKAQLARRVWRQQGGPSRYEILAAGRLELRQ